MLYNYINNEDKKSTKSYILKTLKGVCEIKKIEDTQSDEEIASSNDTLREYLKSSPKKVG